MTTGARAHLRTSHAGDVPQLLALWELLYDDVDTSFPTSWKRHAREWLALCDDDSPSVRVVVCDVDGELVATATGTIELGVPNSFCPRGRTVRLAHVITVPSYRGRGHATELVRDVTAWARTVDADRIDLSATPGGQRIYERLGFVHTSAPRMKLIL